MAAILGLQDSNDLSTYRFQNWRRAILYRFPNGSAPLTALLSLTKSEKTDDPRFNYYEKALPEQASTLSASYLINATTIAVDDAIFRAGHMIKNEDTLEQMLVTGVDATGLVLTVERGHWTTAAAASSGANDSIVIIGNANAEGSGSPTSLTYAPGAFYNFTQIFKTPFDVTGTALKTSLKYDATGPFPEKAREGLNFHSIEMEKAFLFGEPSEFADPTTGRILRTTQGIVPKIYADVAATNVFAGIGNLTQALWDSYLEVAFRTAVSKDNSKLALMGSGFLSYLNTIFRGTGRITLVPAEDTFGIQIFQYISPHGTVYFKSHPLFSQRAAWRGSCLIVDFPALKYRYLTGRDTVREKNIQANDADMRKDQFKTECGLEVHHSPAHVWCTGATGTA